jgi:hypothetical protein
MGGQVVFTQDDRPTLLAHHERRSFRKTARIIAVKQDKPFMVYTEHGPISGEPGDWLATNHPDDDPGSDIWPVSAERMTNTYDTITDGGHPDSPHRFKAACLDCGELGQVFIAILGPDERVVIAPIPKENT